MKALKTALLALALPFIFRNTGEAQQTWKAQPNLIQTRWAKQVSPNNALKEYPRPQLERKSWQNLNGLWEYAITKKDAGMPSSYDGKILVPFPVESSLSGVKRELLPEQNLWYRRTIERSLSSFEMTNKRILLHFGAVDWQATVYLNGKEIGSHTGGYTAFSFDITEHVKKGKNELVVKVYDPTDKGIGPHGKQVLNPSSIYYTPSSGIWQTVWLETVPKEYIEGLKITPDVDKGEVSVEVNGPANAAVEVRAFEGKREIASSRTPRNDGQITLKIPDAKLWSPDDPFLYDLEVTLGKDKVKSYFGMRKISVGKDEKGIDRIMLNNKPYFNLGTLDQGFWPDGLYTAPTDEALAFDIKAIKAMGFNTIRKHIKVEPARWYYHADKLGMLVWQDMVNANQGLPEGSKQAFEQQNKETIAQLYNYPSIATWVLFNEKWGQYDQARLTSEIKKADPSRLVNGHSGEYLYVNNQLRSPSPDAYINADMTDVHSYPNPMISEKQAGKAQVLGEFGGIGVPIENHLWDDTKAGWGYDGIVTPQKMKAQYSAMIDSLVKLKEQGLSGSIYTQPFDVETEQNGLMTYDRLVVKMNMEDLRAIHSKLQPVKINYEGLTESLKGLVGSSDIKSYDDQLQEYKNGRSDISFIRWLAIRALNEKDTVTANKLSKEYLNRIGDTLTEANINFIAKFSSKKLVQGTEYIRRNIRQFVSYAKFHYIPYQFWNIIYLVEFKDLLDTNPKWNQVEILLDKYNRDASKSIFFSILNHYRRAYDYRESRSLTNFYRAALIFDKRYGIEGGMLNQLAWLFFQESSEKEHLETALIWSKKSIEGNLKKANYIDTYANLLHKLGRTKEAIEWEGKALTIEPYNQEFKDTLDKMQKGLATWRVPEDEGKKKP